jgi:hypothetical protein
VAVDATAVVCGEGRDTGEEDAVARVRGAAAAAAAFGNSRVNLHHQPSGFVQSTRTARTFSWPYLTVLELTCQRKDVYP